MPERKGPAGGARDISARGSEGTSWVGRARASHGAAGYDCTHWAARAGGSLRALGPPGMEHKVTPRLTLDTAIPGGPRAPRPRMTDTTGAAGDGDEGVPRTATGYDCTHCPSAREGPSVFRSPGKEVTPELHLKALPGEPKAHLPRDMPGSNGPAEGARTGTARRAEGTTWAGRALAPHTVGYDCTPWTAWLGGTPSACGSPGLAHKVTPRLTLDTALPGGPRSLLPRLFDTAGASGDDGVGALRAANGSNCTLGPSIEWGSPAFRSPGNELKVTLGLKLKLEALPGEPKAQPPRKALGKRDPAEGARAKALATASGYDCPLGAGPLRALSSAWELAGFRAPPVTATKSCCPPRAPPDMF